MSEREYVCQKAEHGGLPRTRVRSLDFVLRIITVIGR